MYRNMTGAEQADAGEDSDDSMQYVGRPARVAGRNCHEEGPSTIPLYQPTRQEEPRYQPVAPV